MSPTNRIILPAIIFHFHEKYRATGHLAQLEFPAATHPKRKPFAGEPLAFPKCMFFWAKIK